MIRRFTPLASYLSKKIGRPVTVEVSKDYQSHIDLIGKDQVDIAYMGPTPYVKLVDTYGKKQLLAGLEINGEATFQGIIIAARNNPIRTLSELKGKRFAFGDPNSTMSSQVPRYMLWQAGVGVDQLANYTFLSNHHNVALGVLMGDFDAGAVKEEVFYEYKDRGLKMLKKTPLITEHVFVASIKLPPETVKALQEALYSLNNTEDGLAIMVRIKKDMTGMVPTDDRNFDNLRNILGILDKLGVKP